MRNNDVIAPPIVVDLCVYTAMKITLLLGAVIFTITLASKQSICAAGKTKQLVHSIPIQGQDDLEFYEGDDPCKVIKKYCKRLTHLFAYEKCFELLHARASTHIGQLWETLHNKLKVNEGLFITCDVFRFDAKEYVRNLNDEEVVTTSRNSSAVIRELLAYLENAMQRDQQALVMFNSRRNELKLTDLEKVLLYRRALLMLPTNLFVVDQFGLALLFVDREIEARALFANAVARGLWGNPLQRPVSKYVKGLTSKPWHDKNDYPFITKLEEGVDKIKHELLYNLEHRRHLFTGETENLHVGGEWTELRIKSSGFGLTKYTEYFTDTMKVIADCGQEFVSIKFSAIQPGTHIRTHTGPSNERLRLHLTLIHKGGARIRVGTEWRTWEQGKAIIFDDSWEHEVIHTGDDVRVVLIMDIWHPELPSESRIIH